MIIDGKMISQSLKDAMKIEVDALAEQYGRRPCLMVIIVGNNPASRSYVRGKIKATEYCGFDGHLVELPEDCSEATLLAEIDKLNNDPLVDGILVQLPLPKHISEDKVIAAISAEKDVDGFHPENVARLWLNQHCILPCTPKGIIELLDQAGVEMAGKKAVVIGRSNIVGKPVAKLLLDRNATVTIAHSRTKDLAAVCREADILVAAVGRAKMVTAEYVKPGAAVIDVGINRTEDGKLVGDVDYDAVLPVAGAITPVPGGVGPMTITMLMRNTIECFHERQILGKSYVQKHFQLRKFLIDMDINEQKYIPQYLSHYNSIKCTCSQLKRKCCGIWKVSKRRKKHGISEQNEGTYITRLQ